MDTPLKKVSRAAGLFSAASRLPGAPAGLNPRALHLNHRTSHRNGRLACWNNGADTLTARPRDTNRRPSPLSLRSRRLKRCPLRLHAYHAPPNACPARLNLCPRRLNARLPGLNATRCDFSAANAALPGWCAVVPVPLRFLSMRGAQIWLRNGGEPWSNCARTIWRRAHRWRRSRSCHRLRASARYAFGYS